MTPDAGYRPTDWPPGRVAFATLVVAVVVGTALFLYYFSNVFFLLLIGVVAAIALSPVVALAQRAGLSRASASVIVYLLVCAVLTTGACFALPVVYEQTAALVESLPHTYRQLREYLLQTPSELVTRFARRLPPRLSVGGRAAPAGEAIDTVAQLLSYGGVLAQGVYLAVATMLLAFYWSVYEDRTLRTFLLVMPAARREATRELIGQIEAKLGAYLRAQGLLCLIMGGLVFAAYWLIGVPNPLSLAIVAGVLEALPVFGPVLAAIPALLVALSAGSSTALWTLVAIVVLQQFESNVLVPRLMDRSVGVNAIVTLLGIAALSALWGLAGAILAIPLAAVAQLMLARWLFQPSDPAELLPVPGRDAMSLLRYELRELLRDVQTEFRRKPARVTWRSDRLEEQVERLARDIDLALAAAAARQVMVAAPRCEVVP